MVPIEKVFKLPRLYNGDDWSFHVHLGEISASQYTLSYVFKKNEVLPFTITATNDNGSFLFTVPNATTSTYVPGRYVISAYVIDSNNFKTTIGQSEIYIQPNLATENTQDPRSRNRRALSEVEEALAACAGSDIVEYSIDGTTYKMDRRKLLDLRAFYMQRVRIEDGKSGIQTISYWL